MAFCGWSSTRFDTPKSTKVKYQWQMFCLNFCDDFCCYNSAAFIDGAQNLIDPQVKVFIHRTTLFIHLYFLGTLGKGLP